MPRKIAAARGRPSQKPRTAPNGGSGYIVASELLAADGRKPTAEPRGGRSIPGQTPAA